MRATPDLRLRAPARAALALALVSAACAKGGISPDLAADPAALLAEVKARQEQVRSVRGTARVRIDAPGVKGTVTELVAAEKPARLRLETLDFFGNPVAVLVADGDRFGFYDSRSRTYWRGDATAENVSRFLPVVLPPEELVTILCGSAPILPGQALEAVPRDGTVHLVVGAGEVGQRLVVGEKLAVESSRVRRAAADPAAQAAFYDLDLGEFRPRGGVRFPTVVALDAASASARLRLAWKADLEVNERNDDGLFSLAPPRGATVVDLPPGVAMPPVELPLEPEE
jgi:outer membrane lipoprotein-sorting protein